jgi:hypothetical protein
MHVPVIRLERPAEDHVAALPGNHVRDVSVFPAEGGVALDPWSAYNQNLTAGRVNVGVLDVIQLCYV